MIFSSRIVAAKGDLIDSFPNEGNMSPISETSFKDWQSEQFDDPVFVAFAYRLEPGYQIARLRIRRGLTQVQLAKLVGVHESTIARVENGTSIPRLSFLRRIANALGASIEVRIIPKEKIIDS